MKNKLIGGMGVLVTLIFFHGLCHAAGSSTSFKSPYDEMYNMASSQDWDPVEEMGMIQQRMDKMFKDAFKRLSREEKELAGGKKESFEPNMDLKETKAEYIISMDLPGMNKEEINISLKDHLLTISGERKSESKQEGEKFFQEEQNYGFFSRSVNLPDDANLDNINAEYKNGVLKVIIYRIPAVKQPAGEGMKIQIK